MEGSPECSIEQPVGKPTVTASIDLCSVPEVVPRGRRRKALRNKTADVSFDLTEGSQDLMPPKRSRRAADAVGEVVATVELDSEPSQPPLNHSFNTSQESTASNDSSTSAKRGGRPRKGVAKKAPPKKKAPAEPKVPKPKRLTLKEALAVASIVIPQPMGTPQPAPAPAPAAAPVLSPRQARNVARASRSSAVDLTGDIFLDSMHSSAPLFQKQPPKKQEEPAEDLDQSQEDDDAVRIKIKIKDKIKAFSFRRYQRFLDLYKQISEKEGIPVSSLFLYDGTKRIHAEDTPHSVDYKISTIYTCHVMSGAKQPLTQLTGKDTIEIKFQSDKWKKPVALKVSRMDTFTAIVGTLCEQVGFRPNQMSLRFDGDKIDLSETPIDLDFEGGEIVDCRVSE